MKTLKPNSLWEPKHHPSLRLKKSAGELITPSRRRESTFLIHPMPCSRANYISLLLLGDVAATAVLVTGFVVLARALDSFYSNVKPDLILMAGSGILAVLGSLLMIICPSRTSVRALLLFFTCSPPALAMFWALFPEEIDEALLSDARVADVCMGDVCDEGLILIAVGLGTAITSAVLTMTYVTISDKYRHQEDRRASGFANFI